MAVDPEAEQREVTLLLAGAAAGQSDAAERLLNLVYDELRALAEARLACERSGQTLQATALVHEAYLRLLPADGGEVAWAGRAHFFAAAAEAMRRILIDRARARGALKRGGGARRLTLDLSLLTADDAPDGLLELDEALSRLAREAPEKAALVKLRFYTGLSMPQAAAALGISQSTAERYWSFARAWLFTALADTTSDQEKFTPG